MAPSRPVLPGSADADLNLLSKRAPPPGAWQGKVVWIVGASQVRPQNSALRPPPALARPGPGSAVSRQRVAGLAAPRSAPAARSLRSVAGW